MDFYPGQYGNFILRQFLITGDIERNIDIWKAFGWAVYTIDGHSEEQITHVLNIKREDTPGIVFAKTIKGYGVSFMENNYEYHSRVMSKGEINKAIIEIEEN